MPVRLPSKARIAIGLLLLIFVAGCVGTPHPPPPSVPAPPGLRSQKPYRINGIWYYPLPSAEGYVEEGLASWYGADFHGKPTSCGEPYDMNAMTAAHKTLPLGTHVKVTNLRTNRSLILRINDRGPFVAGRIIDLSCRAAQELGTARQGVARVRVEAVQVASEERIGGDVYWKPEAVPSFRYGQFTIQIGAFKDRGNAERLKEKMGKHFQKTQIVQFQDKDGCFYHRVQVGFYQDIVPAKKDMESLRRHGYGDAFVVAVEGK